MKKIIISILYITCLIPQLRAQETLSLKQCREMALTHNKEMAASFQQTESARYTMKSYKGNFFPNLTANATGLYSRRWIQFRKRTTPHLLFHGTTPTIRLLPGYKPRL